MRFPFGLMFIDIDHFKSINDTFGHIIGDKVLRAVANTLRYNLRETDTCGRWGGEEFLALVFKLNKDTLKAIAEKLRSLVEQTVITTEAGIQRRIVPFPVVFRHVYCCRAVVFEYSRAPVAIMRTEKIWCFAD